MCWSQTVPLGPIFDNYFALIALMYSLSFTWTEMQGEGKKINKQLSEYFCLAKPCCPHLLELSPCHTTFAMSEKAETVSHIQRQPLRIKNIFSQNLKEIKTQRNKISLKWSDRLVFHI